jgi:hypothetical protein
MFVSNLFRDIGYRDKYFRYFSQSLNASAKMVPWLGRNRFQIPSNSSLISHPTIQPYTVQLLSASYNNP